MIARWVLVAGLLAACGADRSDKSAAVPAPGDAAAISSVAVLSPAVPAAGDSAAVPAAILFIGTSLTAGLGVEPDQAYPALIQARIDSAHLPWRVVNAGVSGETSAGALRRIDWLLREPAPIVVIETGANDGLRGQEPDSIRANIQAMIDRLRARDPSVRIVLVGMNAMPNLGRDYVGGFEAIYPELARKNNVPLVPSLLAGVGGVDSLNQPDGIHPTPKGHAIMANTIWQTLRPLLAPSS
jgi:acyl-CoA thioesterase-1